MARLMRELSPLFVKGMDSGVHTDIASIRKLRDRLRNGIVETAVKGTELIDFDGLLALDREITDRLTEVAIVVNDLVQRESTGEQLVTVLRGRSTDLGQDRHSAARRTRNLAAVHRHGTLFNL